MKRLVLIFLLGLLASPSFSQGDREQQKERIKALKVAFFTQELNLTNKTAEKFWPVYNKYQQEKRSLHEREHVELENVECFSEEQADAMMNEFLNVEKEEYEIKKQLFNELRKIFSAKEIIKLQKLEVEFHKKLIKEYRSKRERENPNDSE